MHKYMHKYAKYQQIYALYEICIDMDRCSVLCMTVFGVLYVRISVYQSHATLTVPCYSYSPMLLL